MKLFGRVSRRQYRDIPRASDEIVLTLLCHSDGKTNGITMPDGEAHEALIRQAYGAIGLDMAGTAMVEAHGKSYFLGVTLYFFENGK